MKHWYAVYTQPSREELAREHLERQGFDVLAPSYLKRRRHARRVDDVPAPLFPRYIFVSFEVEDPGWRVIRSTRGVVSLVCSGTTPIAVPHDFIAQLKERVGADGHVNLARNAALVPGAKLRIEAGPLAEYEAIFQTMRDEDRVVVLLSILGRTVKAQVPLDVVMPVS